MRFQVPGGSADSLIPRASGQSASRATPALARESAEVWQRLPGALVAPICSGLAGIRYRALLTKIRPVAVRVGLGLVVVLALHALLVTLLLWTGGLGWFLARSTGVVKVEAGHSFSLWPGVVHLRQLHLEVTDSHVHLSLDVPRGRATIALAELLRRRFVTRSVTGEHFVLRLRPRFGALPEERRAALPPLSDPTGPTGQPEPTYLWPIRIAGVAAGFDELWVSELRYLGDAQLRGGFLLAPQQHVSIDPADVSLRGGTLHYGDAQEVLEIERLAVQGSLPETRVEELRAAWRERLKVSVDLTARMVDLAFAGNLMPALGALSGGKGDLRLRAAAEHAQWVGDFELDYASEHVGYTFAGLRGSTSIVLAARAPAAAPGQGEVAPLLPAELRLARLSVTREQRQLVQLREARLALLLTREFPFALPRSLEVEVQDLQLAELERLPGVLSPTGWSPRAARVPRARAELDWREGGYKGEAELVFADASFGLGDWSVRQSGRLVLDGLRWPGPGYKVRLSALRLDLDPLRLQHPEMTIDSWRLKLQLDELALSPLERRLQANFSASGDDARPVLSLLGVRTLPPGAADFLAMPELRVLGHVVLAPAQQELVIERAQSKTIDVKGRFVRRNSAQHAALLFKAMPLSLGIAVQPGDTSVKLFAGDAWLDARLGLLAAALDDEAPHAAASSARR